MVQTILVHTRSKSTGLSLFDEQNIGLLEIDIVSSGSSSSSSSSTSSEEFDEKIEPRSTSRYTFAKNFQSILRSCASAAIHSVTPTITLRYLFPSAPRKLRPTSYLDGLRGVAALLVAIHHFCLCFFPSLSRGFGSSEEDVYIFQLPVLRILVAGRFMVAIFFCISGYVLSYNALRLSRARQYDALLKSLSSSFFRRWFRLMIPCFASIIISLFLTWFHLYHTTLPRNWHYPVPVEYIYSIELAEPHHFLEPVRQSTLDSQLHDWVFELFTISDIWRFGSFYSAPYNPVLWTIQTELMGSFVVYALVLALASTRSSFKLLILTLLALQASGGQGSYYILFMSGIFIAETNLVLQHRAGPALPFAAYLPLARPRWLVRSWPYAAFIFGIYVGSHPINMEETSGFVLLQALIPPWWPSDRTDFFWPTIGAILIVGSLTQAQGLQMLFNSGVSQWLGEISFSLYLLHLLVLQSCAKAIIPWCIFRVKDFLGEAWQDEAFIIGMGAGIFVVAGGLFWASDVFTRLVDQRAVRWAKSLNERVMMKQDESS